MNQINEPDPNLVLLDVRTEQEYLEKEKIPYRTDCVPGNRNPQVARLRSL